MDAAAKDLDDPRVINGSSVTKDHLLSRLSALTGVLVAVVVLLVCYCGYMILRHRHGKGPSSVGVERVSSNPLDRVVPYPAVVEVGGGGKEDKSNAVMVPEDVPPVPAPSLGPSGGEGGGKGTRTDLELCSSGVDTLLSDVKNEREMVQICRKVARVKVLLSVGVEGVRAAGERERDELRRKIKDLCAQGASS
jgi:hypothetical protein